MENSKTFSANINFTEGEVSQLCSYKDELSKGNQYYWRIPKGLPSSDKFVRLKFKLNNKIWEYRAFYDASEWLNICIDTTNNDDHHLFDMHIGIVNDSHKEFALKKAIPFKRRKSMVIGLIQREKLDSVRLTSELLYIMLDMRRKDKEDTHEIKDRKRKFGTDFKELLISGKSSDITVEVKRKKFNCHKYILESGSPVFAAMMRHDMVEKASGLVTIKDTEPTTFQEFLLFLYNGDKNCLNWKNVTDLYKLSDKYAVEDLKDACVENIKRNIEIKNFFEFFEMSQFYSDLKLTDVVVQFFIKKSKEIVESEKWIKFLRENPVKSNVLITALVNKLIQS